MKSHLDLYDFAVIVLIFGTSVFIGLYHGLNLKQLLGIKSSPSESTRSSNDVAHYLNASSSMGYIPITFSLLASFFSATALLGIPAEIYQFGMSFWLIAFSYMIGPVLGAFFTGPMFSRLGLSSVFEYLDLRFQSYRVRNLGTWCYMINTFISTSIFIYGPAVSIRAYYPSLSDVWSICLVGLVATTYTALGGIKAVIWTDFFQFLIMLTSIMMILVKGFWDLGWSEILERSEIGGRLTVLDFNPNPFVRQSAWSILIGFFITFAPYYCTDQQTLQRFSATKTKRLAQKALLLNAPGGFLMISLCCLVGLVVYATYWECDPLSQSGGIKNPNHIVIYFIQDRLELLPAASGLFLSAVFCGSLSSVSSTLNSMAAIVWHDFINGNRSRTNNVVYLKLVVVLLGILSSLFALIIASMGSNLQQISTSLKGAFVSPILSLFVLGCFFGIVNSSGAIVGALSALAFGLFMSIGTYIVRPVYPEAKLETSLDGCDEYDFNINTNQTSMLRSSDDIGWKRVFYLSYMWYSAVGTLIAILVALVVSVVSRNNDQDSKSYILFDVTNFIWRKLPFKSRRSYQVNDDECRDVRY